jgi:hypothetical protein
MFDIRASVAAAEVLLLLLESRAIASVAVTPLQLAV